jgi:hypothetical protein
LRSVQSRNPGEQRGELIRRKRLSLLLADATLGELLPRQHDAHASSRIPADQAVLMGGRQERLHQGEREPDRVRLDAARLDVPGEVADVLRLDRFQPHPAEERDRVLLESLPIVVACPVEDAFRRAPW